MEDCERKGKKFTADFLNELGTLLAKYDVGFHPTSDIYGIDLAIVVDHHWNRREKIDVEYLSCIDAEECKEIETKLRKELEQ